MLDRILTANFDENDQHVVLTYRNDELPTIEDSKKILKNFLNRARRFYAKHNVEFKYVFVTEWNAKRIHHHIVCNSVPGVNTSAEISRLWGHGGAHLTPLYEDKDFNGLAEYLVKETKDRFRDDGNPYKQERCHRNDIVGVVESVIREDGREVSCTTRAWHIRERMWLILPAIVRRYALGIMRRMHRLKDNNQ